MLLTAAIVTIFTIAGYANASADVVGTIQDQEIIGESLSKMKDTAIAMEEKALAETDPLKKEIKLKLAEKVRKSYQKLSGEKLSDLKGAVIKQAAGASKMVIGEIAGEVAEKYLAKQAIKTAAKNILPPVAIFEGILENAITAKNLLIASKYDANKTYAMMATSSDSLDTEIELIKAKATTKEAQNVNAELRQMMIDMGIDPDNPDGPPLDDEETDNTAAPANTPAPSPTVQNFPAALVPAAIPTTTESNGYEYPQGDYYGYADYDDQPDDYWDDYYYDDEGNFDNGTYDNETYDDYDSGGDGGWEESGGWDSYGDASATDDTWNIEVDESGSGTNDGFETWGDGSPTDIDTATEIFNNVSTGGCDPNDVFCGLDQL